MVLLPYVAYAVATGRELEAVRYVLVSDAISRRTESVVDGFSGKVVDEILKDFPEAKLSPYHAGSASNIRVAASPVR